MAIEWICKYAEQCIAIPRYVHIHTIAILRLVEYQYCNSSYSIHRVHVSHNTLKYTCKSVEG